MSNDTPGFEVAVQRATEYPGIPADEQLAGWAGTALEGRRSQASLTIRVVDQAEGQALNQRYRGRDYATNVLSFSAAVPETLDLPDLGDLVLCAPVVMREAVDQGKEPADHWAHLVVHGVLHLLGYDHSEGEAAAAMEALEIDILAGLGIADPYLLPPAAAAQVPAGQG